MRLSIRLCLLACCLATASGAAQDDAAEEIGRANATVEQLYGSGARSEALGLAVETLERAETLLGPEHPATLTSVNNLAFLYESQARFGEAEPLYRRALEARERVLGPEHPHTLASVNNLAALYESQGRFGEAEPLYRRALEASDRVLGPEHPQTLASVNNLAGLYWAEGRFGEAEPLYRRALEVRVRVLGPEHPDTLGSVNNLAGLYESQGRFGEAEPLFRRALEAGERVLGPEHPDMLGSVNNLAALYESQGRFGEAEPLYRRALEVRVRVLGPEHPDTLRSVNNLAGLYWAQGRFGEAEPLYRRALEARERVLGPEHPDTLTSVNNLAALYQAQGRFGEAEPLSRLALEARERVLGPEHPDTLRSVNSLAGHYESQGRFGEAEPLLRRLLEARERVLGSEHPDTLGSVNNLAFLYQSQGRFAEAEPLSRRALEASERVLGPEHPETLATRGNLAVLLVRTGRPGDGLRELRALDLHLGQWLDTEVRTTRAAAMQRQALRLASRYQDAAFSLALTHPSEAGSAFAADLVLRWKKRLAQEDAVLNNLARESGDPALTETIAAVLQGRAALSNVAFDPAIPPEEKLRLREALEAAEAELRAQSATFDRFQSVKSARADEVQLALPRASALVEYRFFDPFDFEQGSFGPTRLLAVVLTPETAPTLVDLGEVEPLVAVQRAMIDADLRAAEGLPFDAVARTGFDTLIAPLLPHLDEATTLFLAPDGPLNALPFEALSDADGKRLLERFHVRMLQTGRDLVARDRPVLGKGLVAVGGVDFGPKPAGAAPEAPAPAADAPPEELAVAALATTRASFGGFGELPQSRAEATNIAAHYAAFRPDEPAPVLLVGADATEGALKTLAVPPRVLHLATHGYYLEAGSIDGQPLLQSGITLAGANRALAGQVGPDGENGVLHAVEAQTLNLYGTELVVLSACDTGKGAVDYSEGLEGLPRALYVAGAKNVLVALWPIGDLAARNFMERFYETWLAQPISDPALALRQTKLAHIQSPNPTEHDPAAWAPFVLFEG